MIIGIDIGTEGLRAVTFDEQNKEFKEFKENYRVYFPAPEQAIQKPEEIFNAFKRILKNFSAVDSKIYIGFSSVFHSILALDTKFIPITDSIIWADRRAVAEKEFLEKEYGSRFFYERTGCPLHAMYWPAKILWIKKRIQNVAKFSSIKSYLIYRITGKLIEELSLASGTGIFNIHQQKWDKEILEILDLNERELPELVSPYELIKAKNDFSKEMGFDEIYIIPGAGDGVLANFGVGAIDSKTAVVTVGTSGAVRLFFNEPILDNEGTATWCYLFDEKNYVLGSAINNGGIVLMWLRETMKFDSYEEIIDEAMKSSPGAKGLVFLPYLNGERCPNWVEKYKGVIVGLTSLHSRNDIARSALEGIGFRVKDMLESVKKVGRISPERIIATGGFTNSKDWIQIVSNILGEKLEITNTSNQSAIGAYLVAMKALNLNWEKFLDENIKIETIVNPLKEDHKLYRDVYRKYRYLYDLLLNYWKEF
ncbi:MAG: gluconokinase [Thermotogaceae bacterium]|nr:gluconokinase [Thermotogaceae bacterium]